MGGFSSGLAALMNRARNIADMFPGVSGLPGNTKHNYYKDFGLPEKVSFHHVYGMYRRNGIAKAGINKTIKKTWQDLPDIFETPDPELTSIETEVQKFFADLGIWQTLIEVDRRAMIGGYSAVVLRVADGRKLDQPVSSRGGGFEMLRGVVPAWKSQIRPIEWDSDLTSENYGKPTMYEFKELPVDEQAGKEARIVNIHADRVVLWSSTGDVDCESSLEAGYNDLMAMEKIIGAGGEGFWKNAKSAPVLEIDKEANIAKMAQAMGVDVSDIKDKMDEQVDDFMKGFDAVLMLQGIQAKTLSVKLPSPEHFFSVAMMSFAASLEIPHKILVGTQTGERASTEDAQEWAYTCKARRTELVVPRIKDFVNRLRKFGILADKEWFVHWTDLAETTMAEKTERSYRMSDMSQRMGIEVFTVDEIREVMGYEPKEEERILDKGSPPEGQPQERGDNDE